MSLLCNGLTGMMEAQLKGESRNSLLLDKI